jgi:hypothetical protein
LASCFSLNPFIGSLLIVLNGQVISRVFIHSSDGFLQMDQRPYPGPPPLFHFRMSALFVLLWGIDCLMFLIAAEHTLTNGVGGMVLFASEVRDSTPLFKLKNH